MRLASVETTSTGVALLIYGRQRGPRTRLRVSGAKPVVTDGPFAETKELVGHAGTTLRRGQP